MLSSKLHMKKTSVSHHLAGFSQDFIPPPTKAPCSLKRHGFDETGKKRPSCQWPIFSSETQATAPIHWKLSILLRQRSQPPTEKHSQVPRSQEFNCFTALRLKKFSFAHFSLKHLGLVQCKRASSRIEKKPSCHSRFLPAQNKQASRH